MVTDLSRRSFGALGLGACASLAMPSGAFAMTTESASALVSKLVNDINKVIASGKSESAMYRDFEKIFVKYADVSSIALVSLGADRRRASKSQLKAYTKAYQGYIARKYGKRFREFIGGRLELQSAKPVKKYVEVTTIAHLRGEAPFDVKFLVSDRSGREKFINMYIEGVNMVLTEKTEIGSMLDRRGGDINALIADLGKAS
ncbi:phospholipid transport system substrate-binding protein [Aliiruegeria haliotis]|uniref:Phospholipid transport system substrate-binding protein n=1 Tax=Aliiruegeria haliotis TaxID=1280846 RepID=A0A2T0RTI6_9RHOB|nr:ABC transporter substrate-binding protein [Aliiruegeria haliotis]PRY24462.1 phospholipid transport system substrate-binding protein [Aliiruegeria haliotis]